MHAPSARPLRRLQADFADKKGTIMTELRLQPAAVRTGLDDALEFLLLSRKAGRCTPRTIEHYRYTLGSSTEYLAI